MFDKQKHPACGRVMRHDERIFTKKRVCLYNPGGQFAKLPKLKIDHYSKPVCKCSVPKLQVLAEDWGNCHIMKSYETIISSLRSVQTKLSALHFRSDNILLNSWDITFYVTRISLIVVSEPFVLSQIYFLHSGTKVSFGIPPPNSRVKLPRKKLQQPGDSLWPFWDGDSWPLQRLSDLQLRDKKVTNWIT